MCDAETFINRLSIAIGCGDIENAKRYAESLAMSQADIGISLKQHCETIRYMHLPTRNKCFGSFWSKCEMY